MPVQTKTNVFGQQYIELPLTLKNVTGGTIIIEKIYVRNILSESQNQDHLNITIDEIKSDYSGVNILNENIYQVNHYSGDAILDDPDKNFRVHNRFSLDPDATFTFTVVFNPNKGRFNIIKGNYSALLTVKPESISIENWSLNLSATCDDKEIHLFGGVDYDSIESVYGIERSRIISLN
tara:strand:- start:964 stop:1500 length:537 start_codon:yes stop_codon:yes gene_type:complete